MIFEETKSKTDGTPPTIKSIDATYENYLADPDYDGENRSAGGRPRDLTPEQEKIVKDILLRDVGRVKVTARYVKKIEPQLRHCLDKTIQRTFQRLGYSYRYRRKKAAIGKKYIPERLKYCAWLQKQEQRYLNRFAYTDGTTFFLPRDDAEREDKERAALGPKCW